MLVYQISNCCKTFQRKIQRPKFEISLLKTLVYRLIKILLEFDINVKVSDPNEQSTV